jgi:hypothetical protein
MVLVQLGNLPRPLLEETRRLPPVHDSLQPEDNYHGIEPIV